MLNPLVAAREAMQLNRTQAAVRMGANYHSLTMLEHGLVASVSEAWRPRFVAMGWDFENLRTQYDTWRQSRIGH